MNLSDIAKVSNDEDAAYRLLESIRWPDGPTCPHCGAINHAWYLKPKNGARMTTRKTATLRRVWKCGECRKQFSVTVGTIFERSHIPLWKWLMAFYLMNANKNGASAHEIHRELGITYKSAWFMMHRIRHALEQSPYSFILDGTVEMDETYIGGHKKGQRGGRQTKDTNKTAVISLVQRGGDVRSEPVEAVTAKNIRRMIRDSVDGAQTHLMTDNYGGYRGAIFEVASHDTVDHGAGEYVRGKVHTNTVEGYFSQLKRSLDGTYHHVSQQHLHRYLNEFDYRYNTRHETDSDRTVEAIRKTVGRRLMYRDTGKDHEAES